MATLATKPVRRRTTWRAPHVAPQVVISIYPDGTVGLREVRRRREILVDAATIYTRALLDEARKARQERKRARKGRS